MVCILLSVCNDDDHDDDHSLYDINNVDEMMEMINWVYNYRILTDVLNSFFIYIFAFISFVVCLNWPAFLDPKFLTE